MRATELLLTLITLAVPATAQQPAPAAAKPEAPATTDPSARKKLNESAMKFVEASDARQRLEKNLDKLLDEGKRSTFGPNSGASPQFADEWMKLMRLRIKVDDIVSAIAQVYEKYFTSDELDELTQAQLALKRSQVHTLSPGVAEKLKADSPHIQQDINAATSLVVARVSREVGAEIEIKHPDWVKPPTPASPPAPGK